MTSGEHPRRVAAGAVGLGEAKRLEALDEDLPQLDGLGESSSGMARAVSGPGMRCVRMMPVQASSTSVSGKRSCTSAETVRMDAGSLVSMRTAVVPEPRRCRRRAESERAIQGPAVPG
jgi:hypothetical protein